MGRRRSNRHRYGPKGEYRGHTSDDGPFAKAFHVVVGLIALGAAVWLFRGCQ